jgi:hypothetical protein
MSQADIMTLLERATVARRVAAGLRREMLEEECERMEARLVREQAAFERIRTERPTDKAPARLTPGARGVAV